MQVFYSNEIDGTHCFLSEEESKHASKVLRLRKGDEVCVTDGNGVLYKGSMAEINSGKCVIWIEEELKRQQRKAQELHLAVAPTKNADRIEWMLEKAVELGLSTFTPIICSRSERRNINIERLERIALSAMKQSLNLYKPVINEAVVFDKFISANKSGSLYIAHCIEADAIEENYKTESLFTIKSALGENMTMLIGPEGDFSPDEVRKAVNVGYKPVSLGENRLRTETAALVVANYFYIQESF